VNEVTRAPIVGAVVIAVDDPSSPPVVHVSALRTPLYFDHPVGTPVQLVTLTAGGTANLNVRAESGTNVVEISTRAGLVPGSVIQLSDAARLLVEYGVVDHLGPGAPAAAGQVFFKNALNRTHGQNAATLVQFMTAALSGAPSALSADSNSGDGVVLAGQLFGGGTLALASGTPVEEYHEIGALSDSDGYYGFDGMGRVPQIFMKATQGLLKQTIGWFIEYDRSVNLVDFRLL
jgi:hypothetical protein